VYKIVKDLRTPYHHRPLVVGGARELAGVLRRELSRGATPGAVVEGGAVERAAAVVHVLAGPPADADVDTLRTARRHRVPTVCVLADPAAPPQVPYVLATDIVRVPPGSGFPTDEIVELLARRLGEDGIALATRVPGLRRPLCRELISQASRRNALFGAVTSRPGLPILTLNQLRLVLRIAAAHGLEIDGQRLPEGVVVVGGGIGFRLLARRLLALIPFAERPLRGAVAYAGTRAMGEAALRFYEAWSADGRGASPRVGETPRPRPA
jgi:uncharacterized protein (DUF697 family)